MLTYNNRLQARLQAKTEQLQLEIDSHTVVCNHSIHREKMSPRNFRVYTLALFHVYIIMATLLEHSRYISRKL